MNSTRCALSTGALACLVALAAPQHSAAQPAPAPAAAAACDALAIPHHAEFEPRAPHGAPPGPGPFGPEEAHGFGPPLPPFLRGIALSDEQQDRIFSIHHELEPTLRLQARAASKARERLHAMAQSDSYDEAAARAVADAQAKAQTELALLHARAEHEMLQALTPEQRKQAAAARACGPDGEGARAPWF